MGRKIRYYSSFLMLAFAAGAETRLETLIREALERNPEILEAQKKYESACKRPDQVSALPETMLGVGWTSNGRPWPGAGLGREPLSNIGVMVTQEFPFFGKRKLRGDIARKEAQAEWEHYQAVQLAVVSRLKQAYFRLAYTQLAKQVLDRNRDLLEQLLKVAEVRYAAGRAAQQDIFKLQTQLSILETRQIQLEREAKSSENELVSLLHRPPDQARIGTAVVRTPEPLRQTLEDLLAAANANSPALQRDRRMIERNLLALNLARKEYLPDYAITAGYGNMGRMPDMYQFRLDVKLPTSFFRKQRNGEAEQAIAVAGSRRALEATAQSLAFRIKDEYLMAETSLRLMRAYEKDIVPQASLALESSLAAYEAGALDMLSVLTNFITVVEYEINYYEEMRNVWLARARLEELTGLHLTGEAP